MDRFIPVDDCFLNTRFIERIECDEKRCLIYFYNGDIKETKGYADLIRLTELLGKPGYWDTK